MRAIVRPHGFIFRTVLDRVVVGCGSREGCQALADELNVSDEKCNALLQAFLHEN